MTSSGTNEVTTRDNSGSVVSVNNKHRSKISILVESLNCKGFKQSSDYLFDCLASCDIMCLSKTWLSPQEQSLIETSLKRNARSSATDHVVFSKSGMCDAEADYSVHPYGGVAVLCKVTKVLSHCELE